MPKELERANLLTTPLMTSALLSMLSAGNMPHNTVAQGKDLVAYTIL